MLYHAFKHSTWAFQFLFYFLTDYRNTGTEKQFPSQITIVCCCLVARLCPTLCSPTDCSPPGFSVCGISQVRILKWIAISFSKGCSQPRDWTSLSYIGRQILYHWATQVTPDNNHANTEELAADPWPHGLKSVGRGRGGTVEATGNHTWSNHFLVTAADVWRI